ncbi:MAG: hypothetical protein AAGK32_20365, partial [Actinomycetota bacterium]
MLVVLGLLATGVASGAIVRSLLDTRGGSDVGQAAADYDLQFPPFEFEVSDLGPAGTCLTRALRQISCSEPHTSEVLVLIVFPETDYPGAKPLQSSAWAGCGQAMNEIPRSDALLP